MIFKFTEQEKRWIDCGMYWNVDETREVKLLDHLSSRYKQITIVHIVALRKELSDLVEYVAHEESFSTCK